VPTHEAERALKVIKLEKYRGEVPQYLWRIENHNIKVGLQEVAWKDVLKEQSRRWLSYDSHMMCCPTTSFG